MRSCRGPGFAPWRHRDAVVQAACGSLGRRGRVPRVFFGRPLGALSRIQPALVIRLTPMKRKSRYAIFAEQSQALWCLRSGMLRQRAPAGNDHGACLFALLAISHSCCFVSMPRSMKRRNSEIKANMRDGYFKIMLRYSGPNGREHGDLSLSRWYPAVSLSCLHSRCSPALLPALRLFRPDRAFNGEFASRAMYLFRMRFALLIITAL